MVQAADSGTSAEGSSVREVGCISPGASSAPSGSTSVALRASGAAEAEKLL